MPSPQISVNGKTFDVDAAPYLNALDWLRGLGLTGCKEGCAEGECGACSILVARPAVGGGCEWTAINACLVPVYALDGQEVITAEGLAGAGGLHPVQHEIAVRGGSQCGYCTPGFACSMAAEYYRDDRSDAASNGSPGDHERGPNGFDLHALSGNLCRCTGYRPIRDAAYALGAPPADDGLAARRAAPAPPPVPTRVARHGMEFVRPSDLGAALALLAERPDAVVVAGATDWGVEVNLRGLRAPLVVAVDALEELRGLSVGETEVEIGAALTLTEIERRLAGRIPLLAEMLPLFASRLIRNRATLGGNLGTGSPIGDAPPVLLALEASVVLASAQGRRTVAVAEYFTGYRTCVRRRDELITAVRIPLPTAPLTTFHKIAKRRFDDISSVAVAYALEVADGTVRRATIGLGGVAATPIRAPATEAALLGRPWTRQTATAAAAVLGGEGTPLDDHRASAAYRAAMLEQSLLKFHAERGSRTEVAQ
jgi:xanthine dehydrogenase small subunit